MSAATLTEQQRLAVEDRGGSLLVSAAAGSGKTRVLVERLFRYVTAEGCNLDDFLIITYTRAAAAELRGKIAAELSLRLAEAPGDAHLRRQLLRVYQADIKTVDAFCTGLLRENTHLLARAEDRHALTPDFRVLDEDDAVLLRRRVLHRTLERFYEELDAGGALLADTLGAGRDDRSLEELVLKTHEKLQSHADPEGWLAENRTAWQTLCGAFDATPYARELLQAVRRKAAYWAEQLRRAAERTAGDEKLETGYGLCFRSAAQGLEQLAASADWEDARARRQGVLFPRLNTPRGRKDEPLIAGLKRLWDGCKEDVRALDGALDVSAAEAMEDLLAVRPAMDALLRLTEAFGRDYRAEKLRMNCADFSDQEHLALRLLAGEDGAPTELGRQISGRYVEILVDEYQDTNEVQNAIFAAVSQEGKNLFTVGDVKQSIYRFRLADPSIFLEQYNRLPLCGEAVEGEARKLLLSRNFRSRREILDAANDVFTNILSPEMGELRYGPEEALHYGAAYPERADCSTEFHLLCAERRSAEQDSPVKKLTAEARFVARRIRDLLDGGYPVTEGTGGRPCTPEDIVVLMRAPGSRTAAFAAALAEQGVPCSFEESVDFFEEMEVSVLCALLELIDNPRQDVPLICVLRSPVFGFTPDRLAAIRSGCPQGDFYDALAADEGEDSRRFLDTLGDLRRAAQDLSVYRLIWHICNQLNLMGIFGAMDEGAARRERLVALGSHARRFEAGGYRGLFAFVTHLRRMREAGKLPETKLSAGASGVRLMSVHKSKGLEFPIVFLCDLDHEFSRKDYEAAVLIHPKLGLGAIRVDLERKIRYATLGRRAVEEKLRRENLAEEQRLLYVAMTRAQEKLIMVDALYGAQTRLQRLASTAACPLPPERVAAARCQGDWLLQTLLCRPEAGALRALAGAEDIPLWTGAGQPWSVCVWEAETFRDAPQTEAKALAAAAEEDADFDPALLDFRYPYAASTVLPAKITATQLKGRALDAEVAENAAPLPPYVRPLEQPRFRRRSRGLTPAEAGTATHLVLQELDFENFDAAEQVRRMRTENRLTAEQAAAVDVRALERFLRSELAEAIRQGRHVRREYRFSILVPATALESAAAEGDELLLQGVVDCCFETEEGIVVVDFKTDRVSTEEELRRRAELYRPQLAAYTLALERLLGRPVVRRALYFLHPGRTVEG